MLRAQLRLPGARQDLGERFLEGWGAFITTVVGVLLCPVACEYTSVTALDPTTQVSCLKHDLPSQPMCQQRFSFLFQTGGFHLSPVIYVHRRRSCHHRIRRPGNDTSHEARLWSSRCLNLHPISDWQDQGDHSVHCPLQLCSQGSEVRLDLAQLMLLYRATRVLPAPTAALPWGAALPVAADPRDCLEAAAGGWDRLRGRSVGWTDRWTDRVAQNFSLPALPPRTQNPPHSPRLPHTPRAPHGEGPRQLRSGASASRGLKNQCKW